MPPIRPWHVLLACLALVVPIQAGALEGGGKGLSVSASLGQCGVAGAGITCRIDVSWSGVDHATRYAATVTLADGSVRDLGTVGGGSGGSTAVWVPYAGGGTYTVTVTAWGSDPEGKDKKLEDDDAEAVIEDDAAGTEDELQPDGAEAGTGKQEEPAQTPEGDGNSDPESPAEKPGSDPAPAPQEPPVEPPAEEPAPPPPPPGAEPQSPAEEDPQKAPQQQGASEAVGENSQPVSE